MFKKTLALIGLLGVIGAFAQAETLFADDFESGSTFAAHWLNAATNQVSASISTAQAHGGTNSAFFPGGLSGTSVTDQKAANLSRVENVGAERIRATFWFYDETGTGLSGGRVFARMTSYAGGAYNVGGLNQLLALGKHNSTTAPEVYSGAKYQCRVAVSSVGWVNMTGAANRSIGWRKFEIVIEGSSYTFKQDDTVGRVVTRTDTAPFDSLSMGSNLSSFSGTTPLNGYFDDISVVAEPLAYVPSSLTVNLGTLLGGNVASLAASDDNKLFILADEFNTDTEVEMVTTIGTTTPTSMVMDVETSCSRPTLIGAFQLYNNTTTDWDNIGFIDPYPETDTAAQFTVTGTLSDYVNASREVKIRWRSFPTESYLDAPDWVVILDLIKITAN